MQIYRIAQKGHNVKKKKTLNLIFLQYTCSFASVLDIIFYTLDGRDEGHFNFVFIRI